MLLHPSSKVFAAIRRTLPALLVGTALLGAMPLAATEPGGVAWHHDVKTAWQSTQLQGRPLLVFVTAKNCMYCVKMKQAYSNATVAATINRSFVPLVLDGEAPCPLLNDLAVKAYPATFIISPNAVILDRLDGYVTPDKLMARLTAAQSVATAKTAARD